MVNVKSKKFLKERKIIYLILFFIFILTAVIYTLLLNNVIGKNYVTSQIQKRVLEIQRDAKHNITNIFKSKQHTVLEYTNSNKIPHSEIFVYQNNAISFWTTARYNIPLRLLLKQHNQIYEDEQGLYFFTIDSSDTYVSAYVTQLVSKAPLKNEYLSQNHIFENDFIQRFSITQNKTKYKICNDSGNTLFYLDFDKRQELASHQILIIFGLILLSILVLYFLIIEILIYKVKNPTLGFLYLVFFSFLLRLFMVYFNEPWIIYQTDLFQPTLYASSSYFFSTLGDAIISSILFLSIGLYLLKGFQTTDNKQVRLKNFLIIILSVFNIKNLLFSLHDIIYNSKIHSNLMDISGLDIYSFLAYFLVGIQIISLLISYLQIFRFVLNKMKISMQYLIFILGGVPITIYFALIDFDFIWIMGGILLIGILFIMVQHEFKLKLRNQLILSVLSFSILITIYINVAESKASDMRNRALLMQLAKNQDPDLEFKFSQIEAQIYQDSSIKKWILNDTVTYGYIEDYIQNRFFNNDVFKKKYDLQLTICKQNDQLNIKPDNVMILCNQYFLQNLIAFGKLTNQSKNLYRLELGSGQINYLGLVQFVIKGSDNHDVITLYFEINSKLKRKGFTKVLSEKGSDPFDKLGKLSFGHYYNDSLVESYGKYRFSERHSFNKAVIGEFITADTKNNHQLIYYSENNQNYILSQVKYDLVDKLALLIYLFFYIVVIIVFILSLYDIKVVLSVLQSSFKIRLQIGIFFLLLSTFILISILSVIKIIDLSEEKNKQNVSELTRILKLEFESKILYYNQNNGLFVDYIDQLVLKFSKIFDTDINIYDSKGLILSTSRPELFTKGLKSDFLSPLALASLQNLKNSSFTDKENIGSFEFYSAYCRLLNEKNQTIAYLNIPYFAKQDDLSNEINNFISTLINVYAIIIFFSLFFAILISRYITLPLSILSEKMRKIQFGKSNDKIVWDKDDEVGQLIHEYNKMLDVLKDSAERLAKSERSLAWTEMAKQVAHEIRNPLTPMKLSVQYLQKTWKDTPELFQQRLTGFTETMISQIDSLNEIANSFSEFAKMPEMIKEKHNPVVIIENVVSLFQKDENITFSLNISDEFWRKDVLVMVNEGYLVRVLNNLLKNAIQAVSESKNPLIIVNLNLNETELLFEVVDNGCGISNDVKEKIFTPYFTTKSGGTGLGLAMSRNIIQDFGGTINFDSIPGKLTTFRITLPITQ